MLSMPFIFISYSHKDSEYANRPAESAETNVRLVQIEMDQAEPARPDLRIPDKPLRLELVRVPAGEFVMGTRTADIAGLLKAYGGEQAWYEWEVPQHRLALPEYTIGKTPVTVSQFELFVKATGYRTAAEEEGWGWVWTGQALQQEQGASWRHPRGAKSDVASKGDHPATQVTWHDAQAFCRWANMRLASEAEWEKAARGVDGRVFPWGDQAPDDSLCNFGMKVGDTTPVSRSVKGASPYGVLDMAGNVWEWTGSLWGTDGNKPEYGYPYNPTDGREDLQAANPIWRVVRGGSYIYGDGSVRCACRGKSDPGRRSDNIGFRVVRVVPSL